MSSQKISVTLNSPSDWDEWIEVIKTQALVGKVWDYVDPSKDQVPALEEPLPPQPKDVNDQASTFGQLTQEEREEYRILRQDYKWQRDLYDKSNSAPSEFDKYLQGPVARHSADCSPSTNASFQRQILGSLWPLHFSSPYPSLATTFLQPIPFSGPLPLSGRYISPAPTFLWLLTCPRAYLWVERSVPRSSLLLGDTAQERPVPGNNLLGTVCS